MNLQRAEGVWGGRGSLSNVAEGPAHRTYDALADYAGRAESAWSTLALRGRITG